MNDKRYDVEISGLTEFKAALEFLSTKEKNRYVGRAMQDAGKDILVPAIKQNLASDIKKANSHKGKKGKQGHSGPLEAKVTARLAKKKAGEIVAVNVAPRAWYRHFFLHGTKPHVISAETKSGSVPVRDVRAYNRKNAAHGGALKLPHGWVSSVNHPGNQGHDSVGRAVQGHGPEIVKDVSLSLFKEMDKWSKKHHG